MLKYFFTLGLLLVLGLNTVTAQVNLDQFGPNDKIVLITHGHDAAATRTQVVQLMGEQALLGTIVVDGTERWIVDGRDRDRTATLARSIGHEQLHTVTAQTLRVMLQKAAAADQR